MRKPSGRTSHSLARKGHAGPAHVAGVVGNFRLMEDDVEHYGVGAGFGFAFFGHRRHDPDFHFGVDLVAEVDGDGVEAEFLQRTLSAGPGPAAMWKLLRFRALATSVAPTEP